MPSRPRRRSRNPRRSRRRRSSSTTFRRRRSKPCKRRSYGSVPFYSSPHPKVRADVSTGKDGGVKLNLKVKPFVADLEPEIVASFFPDQQGKLNGWRDSGEPKTVSKAILEALLSRKIEVSELEWYIFCHPFCWGDFNPTEEEYEPRVSAYFDLKGRRARLKENTEKHVNEFFQYVTDSDAQAFLKLPIGSTIPVKTTTSNYIEIFKTKIRQSKMISLDIDGVVNFNTEFVVASTIDSLMQRNLSANGRGVFNTNCMSFEVGSNKLISTLGLFWKKVTHDVTNDKDTTAVSSQLDLLSFEIFMGTDVPMGRFAFPLLKNVEDGCIKQSITTEKGDTFLSVPSLMWLPTNAPSFDTTTVTVKHTTNNISGTTIVLTITPFVSELNRAIRASLKVRNNKGSVIKTVPIIPVPIDKYRIHCDLPLTSIEMELSNVNGSSSSRHFNVPRAELPRALW